MASISLHPAYVPPMPAVARVLAQFDRERLAGLIEVAIGLLDVMEPDPDLEDNADREHDMAELYDVTYTEWHTRGRHKLSNGRSECGPTTYGAMVDDAEDDDPETGIEDDPLGCDPEVDCCFAGDDLARSGPNELTDHWRNSVARGEQPGDADEHEPWQASRETQDYAEPRDYIQPRE
jgi:hypothetical protein